jgi:hypothetical protein
MGFLYSLPQFILVLISLKYILAFFKPCQSSKIDLVEITNTLNLTKPIAQFSLFIVSPTFDRIYCSLTTFLHQYLEHHTLLIVFPSMPAPQAYD